MVGLELSAGGHRSFLAETQEVLESYGGELCQQAAVEEECPEQGEDLRQLLSEIVEYQTMIVIFVWWRVKGITVWLYLIINEAVFDIDASVTAKDMPSVGL